MKNRSLALGLIATLFLCASLTMDAKPRHKSGAKENVKKCFLLICDDSKPGRCAIFGTGGGGIDVGLAGKAELKQIPCPRNSSTLVNPIHTTAMFIPTDGDPTLDTGIGWTGIDADVSQSQGQAGITVFDESTEYTSLAAWQAAH